MKNPSPTVASSITLLAALCLAPSAAAQATANGATLTVLGSPAEDVITVVFPTTPGVATVFGVPGTPDGTTFNGIETLVVRTFQSVDIVNVQSLSETPPELDIDTGEQDSQVMIDLETPATVVPLVSRAFVRGGTGKDQITFETTSNAPSATLEWTVVAGTGENDMIARYSSDVLGGTTTLLLDYSGGGLVDKVLTDFICKPDVLLLRGLGNTGAGGDEWTVKAACDLNTTVRVQNVARLGAGGDTAVIDVSNAGLTTMRSAFDGGTGDDTLNILTTSSFSGVPLLFGGEDNDVLLVNVQEDLLPGSQPRILAGNGNDTVSMLVSGAVLGTPFSDGGPGSDSFVGVGTAVNFE